MRDFIDTIRDTFLYWWPAILLILLMGTVVIFAVYVGAERQSVENVCIQHGYAGATAITQKYYCYRVEGDHLVTVVVEKLEQDSQ